MFRREEMKVARDFHLCWWRPHSKKGIKERPPVDVTAMAALRIFSGIKIALDDCRWTKHTEGPATLVQDIDDVAFEVIAV